MCKLISLKTVGASAQELVKNGMPCLWRRNKWFWKACIQVRLSLRKQLLAVKIGAVAVLIRFPYARARFFFSSLLSFGPLEHLDLCSAELDRSLVEPSSVEGFFVCF
jgi:hypothetical protein